MVIFHTYVSLEKSGAPKKTHFHVGESLGIEDLMACEVINGPWVEYAWG